MLAPLPGDARWRRFFYSAKGRVQSAEGGMGWPGGGRLQIELGGVGCRPGESEEGATEWGYETAAVGDVVGVGVEGDGEGDAV